jgi:hypothetical protein
MNVGVATRLTESFAYCFNVFIAAQYSLGWIEENHDMPQENRSPPKPKPEELPLNQVA